MQSEAHGWEAQSFPVTSQGSEPGVGSLIKQWELLHQQGQSRGQMTVSRGSGGVYTEGEVKTEPDYTQGLSEFLVYAWTLPCVRACMRIRV